MKKATIRGVFIGVLATLLVMGMIVGAGAMTYAGSNPYDVNGDGFVSIADVSALLTYLAYGETSYTVTFVDYDGRVLKTQSVPSGKAATPPADPTREGYRFLGWDKSFDRVSANLTVTAQYEKCSTDPTVVVENATAKLGDQTVQVVISLENNPGITGMKLSLSYGSALTLTGVEFSPAFGAYVTAPEPYRDPQPISFISPMQSVKANGQFAVLTFAISDSVTAPTEIPVTVSCDQENTLDENLDEIFFATVSGSVKIVK